MLITVTKIRMILVIIKYLKSCLETFINGPEQKQDEFDAVLGALSEYSPIDQKYLEAKNKLLDKAKDFYKGRKKLLKGLKTKYFKFFMKMKIADLNTMMRMILEIIMVSSITKSLID